jgi:hypothetical protein
MQCLPYKNDFDSNAENINNLTVDKAPQVGPWQHTLFIDEINFQSNEILFNSYGLRVNPHALPQ